MPAMTDPLGFWAVADAFGDRPALISPDHDQLSFGALAGLANQVSNGLRALGVGVGDQVTTVLPNGFEQVSVGLAGLQSGLYTTTVNWHLVGPEIAYIVNDSETRVLIVHERFAAEAGRVLDEITVPASHRFAVGDVPGFRPFAELVDGQPTTRPDERTTGAPMFYTSGTTGRPKGVRRALLPLDPDVFGANSGWLFSLFGIEPHDDGVHITQAPLYHTAVNGWTMTSLHYGHTAVLMDKWTPVGALERYERYHVTQSHMVPTMFNRMLSLPEEERTRYDLSSLRQMIHAAAPCPVETKRRMLEWWGPVIWEYYAATEGGGTVVSPQDWLAHPGTVGKPWPSSQVIVVDSDGNEVPPGVAGTIYMKMGAGSFEYFKDKEKTDKNRLRDFWTVGDVGYFDEEGWLYLNDRATDMIIAGGVNIYPAEIEGALVQHPKIADVAVFGIPHADLGEEIKAVVELVDGETGGPELADEILRWAATQLARYKLPRSVDFVEALPRDPNGKLYKRRLRDPYWEGRTRAI
jgi:long-chain acyl-CoA synthetase